MSATDRRSSGPAGPLVEDLLARIAERVEPARADAVAAFARAYTRRLSPETATTAEELFGEVMGLFDLVDRRTGVEPAVRVLNPTLAADGYTTPATVVETNAPDAPFLVDSVTQALQSRGLEVRRLLHPVIGTERGADGRVVRVTGARDAAVRESVMHFEVEPRVPDAALAGLADDVRRVLGDVRRVVRDFDAMRERVGAMIEAARGAGARYDAEEIAAATAFLAWLLDGNFVFLGSRSYAIVDGSAIGVVPGSGLGILEGEASSTYHTPVPLGALDARLRERITDGPLLLVAKTNRSSTVHRRVRMDYIGVKQVDGDGRVLGELRLLGLFTSKAYTEPASRIPLLAGKLRELLRREDLFEGSHDYKTVVELFESLPKDELFAAPVEELRRSVMGLLVLQDRQQVRLFVRRDINERAVSLLVALPRDRFNAALRQRLQRLFEERFHGTGSEAQVSIPQYGPTQIHYTIHVDHGEIPDLALEELEREVAALTRTWDDRLRERLVALHGEERGRRLADVWAARFPDHYKTSTDIYLAVLDIERFEQLHAGAEPFLIGLQNERGAGERLTRVALYKRDGKLSLSAFMPILEHFGLEVVEEALTRMGGPEGETVLHDFGVLGADGAPLDLSGSAARIAEGIAAVWRGEAESDGLNRLVVVAGLDWRQVAVLRAYRTYRRRVSSGFTEAYQDDAFAANPAIARALVALFEARFDPSRPDADRPAAEAAIRADVLARLDSVRSLDEDRILRGFLGAIDATVRTNAYVPGVDRLALKLRSAAVPDMPKPYPLWEVFVYAPSMEGVHLRGGMVARGGLRWSDRREDFRTEVLGLMKAQMVKNAVIVPVGSKGGFVLKRPPADPEALRADVTAQYVRFVRGLLDVTDNRVGGAVVHPAHVVVHDGPDPYLVVAADKGTAAFSDTANEVSAAYGFWLGDAFASGGSAGYDHKALGITARGAWKSVERHFREMGVDVMAQPFTVVGIGDMSGDVFGNGMLLSPHIRLVAAFDHRHVFIDPDPDPARGLAERQRLFALARSSWDDYDRAAISPGGGVWPRTAKRVPLAPEARAALGVEAEALTPTELIGAILRAPVDLLWNGGIGTYVKASSEGNEDVGDRANDALRVDGRDVRARVVGEGGNLGFTQRGRIEYARAGGRINTDAIDNSAGVDTSDHEVNIKILLGLAEARGDLTRKQRNLLLQEVVGEVCEQVLYDNYQQAQILSQSLARSPRRIEAFEDLMQGLEADGALERAIEHLPSTEEMAERARQGEGMTRPELAVLLAYAKRSLDRAVLASTLPDDPYLEGDLARYFPRPVVARFGGLVAEHPLRRELVATIVANDVVNAQGITFVNRLVAETGAEPADVARAFWTARDVIGAVERWEAIEALDGVVDPAVQSELMDGADWLVEAISRWYLANAPGAPLTATIEAARGPFAELSETIRESGGPGWVEAHDAVAADLVGRGVPEAVARRHAYGPELAHGPDIIQVATASGRSLVEVARIFYALGERVHIDWLERRLDDVPAPDRWRRWALQAMEDDLTLVRRELAQRVLEAEPDAPADEAVERWLATRGPARERLDRFVRRLGLEGVTDLPVVTVALRQVRGLL